MISVLTGHGPLDFDQAGLFCGSPEAGGRGLRRRQGDSTHVHEAQAISNVTGKAKAMFAKTGHPKVSDTGIKSCWSG